MSEKIKYSCPVEELDAAIEQMEKGITPLMHDDFKREVELRYMELQEEAEKDDDCEEFNEDTLIKNPIVDSYNAKRFEISCFDIHESYTLYMDHQKDIPFIRIYNATFTLASTNNTLCFMDNNKKSTLYINLDMLDKFNIEIYDGDHKYNILDCAVKDKKCLSWDERLIVGKSYHLVRNKHYRPRCIDAILVEKTSEWLKFCYFDFDEGKMKETLFDELTKSDIKIYMT